MRRTIFTSARGFGNVESSGVLDETGYLLSPSLEHTQDLGFGVLQNVDKM